MLSRPMQGTWDTSVLELRKAFRSSVALDRPLKLRGVYRRFPVARGIIRVVEGGPCLSPLAQYPWAS
jgi:hypothetical protein